MSEVLFVKNILQNDVKARDYREASTTDTPLVARV